MSTLPEKSPRISVIMAVRNEAKHLKETLSSLASQSLKPTEYEVIIADGGSQDGTGRIIEEFRSEQRSRGLFVRCLENSRHWAASGLNRALEVSSGEVVVRVDGHVVLPDDYLQRVFETLASTGAVCAGGIQEPRGAGLWSQAYVVAATSWLGSGGAAYRTQDEAGWVDTVFLGAWPRGALLEAGGFCELLKRNQDDELAMRLRARGGRIWLDPRIRVPYHPREHPWGLARQYFEYGFWKPRVLRRHPRSLRLRHLVPPALVFILTGGAWIALWVGHLPAAGALLPLAAYTTGLFAASSMLALRCRRPSLIFPVMLTAFLQHVAYGLGFLMGIVPALLERLPQEARA